MLSTENVSSAVFIHHEPILPSAVLTPTNAPLAPHEAICKHQCQHFYAFSSHKTSLLQIFAHLSRIRQSSCCGNALANSANRDKRSKSCAINPGICPLCCLLFVARIGACDVETSSTSTTSS